MIYLRLYVDDMLIVVKDTNDIAKLKLLWSSTRRIWDPLARSLAWRNIYRGWNFSCCRRATFKNVDAIQHIWSDGCDYFIEAHVRLSADSVQQVEDDEDYISDVSYASVVGAMLPGTQSALAHETKTGTWISNSPKYDTLGVGSVTCLLKTNYIYIKTK